MRNKQSLYPNILFHFTERESLFKILDGSFKISYAREIIIGPQKTREFAVPMVSFCDLRLSELKNHIDSYGDYGIGLSKKWANANGLNPVMYVSRFSKLADDFNNGLNGIYNHMDKLEDMEKLENLNKSYLNILKTYQYLKNYEGKLIRGGNVVDDNYRFADEREWRYVPDIHKTGIQPFIAISNISTKAQKKKYNDQIKHLDLPIEYDQIKYLIVKNENDLLNLISFVNNNYKINSKNKDMIISRIVTTEQIKNDI